MRKAVLTFCLVICFLPDFVIAQYAPVSTIGRDSTYAGSVIIPVTAVNFINIVSCDLKIVYDPAVATATGVTAGPQLGGNINTNTGIPGVILISWYTAPGITLPDNSVIFKIAFSRAASGRTAINWDDDGYSCLWTDGNYVELIDIPTEDYYINGSLLFENNLAPHTILAGTGACQNTVVGIPVRVSAFSRIGQLNLTLHYDPAVMELQSWENLSGFPSMALSVTVPGTIWISGIVPPEEPGFSLPDSAILAGLTFFHFGGSSALVWDDDGESCAYYGPPPSYPLLVDEPQEMYYINGSVTGLTVPSPAGPVNGPAGGNICAGEGEIYFSIDPVTGAETYHWLFPEGINITSNPDSNVVVAVAGPDASGGEVVVYGENSCGSGSLSPPFTLNVNQPPTLIIQPETPDTVIAKVDSAVFSVVCGGSQLTYQWQEFISKWNDIDNGGVYIGADSSALTIIQPPLAMNGYRYRCLIHGFCPPDTVTDGLATLLVTPVTGTNDKSGHLAEMTLCPVPVTKDSRITIKAYPGASLTLSVTDISGRMLYQKALVSGEDWIISMEFPINGPANGICFICLQSELNGKMSLITRKVINIR